MKRKTMNMDNEIDKFMITSIGYGVSIMSLTLENKQRKNIHFNISNSLLVRCTPFKNY